MVVLEWRYVVVPQRQFRLGVDLVDVVVARVIEVVANARGEEDEDFQVADFCGEVHAPRYRIKLEKYEINT